MLCDIVSAIRCEGNFISLRKSVPTPTTHVQTTLQEAPLAGLYLDDIDLQLLRPLRMHFLGLRAFLLEFVVAGLELHQR